jgi:hypothetical protein
MTSSDLCVGNISCCGRDASPVLELTGDGSGSFLKMFGKAGNRFATMSKCFQWLSSMLLLPPRLHDVN